MPATTGCDTMDQVCGRSGSEVNPVPMGGVVFMGTPHFAGLILQALIGRFEIAAVVTRPDRGAGRGRKLRASCVKALAEEHHLALIQPERLGNAQVIDQLRERKPGLIVVAAFGQILPPSILTIPERGTINVHPSLLPRHRGAAPIPACILAGDARTGVSIMLMDEGLDTGPILSQAELPVEGDDTTASLTEKLGVLGGQLLLDTLPLWLAGGIEAKKQDNRRATYARPLRRNNGRIDWSDPADEIDRIVRACHPWPGAFTYWRETQLKLIRVQPVPVNVGCETAGTVTLLESHPAVVTGQGLLVLEELQLAGKRRLPANEFIRGQRGFVGSTLH